MALVGRVGQNLQVSGIPTDWLQEILRKIRQEFAEEAWAWYRVHRKDVLARKKVWFFTVEVTVEEVRGLFVTIFGEPPEGKGL